MRTRAALALNFMLVDYASSESEEAETDKRKRAPTISASLDAEDRKVAIRPMKKPQPVKKFISLPDPDDLLSGKVTKIFGVKYFI